MPKIKKSFSLSATRECEDGSDFSPSESDYEIEAGLPCTSDSDSDSPMVSFPKRRRIKMSQKLKEYLEPSSQLTPREVLKGWCIIECAGENSFDAVPKKNISSLDDDSCPEFKVGEVVLALYSGKPFKGTIRVIAVQKYKSFQQPKLDDSNKQKKHIPIPKNLNPVSTQQVDKLKRMHELMSTPKVLNYTSVQVRKGENQIFKPSNDKNKKNNVRKDKTAEQLKKEEKERKAKAEIAQMQGVCKYSPEVIQVEEEFAHVENELTGRCCKCCATTKQTLQRQQQELDLMRSKVSVLTYKFENTKCEGMVQDQVMEIPPKTYSTTPQTPCLGLSKETAFKETCESVEKAGNEKCPREFFSAKETMKNVPHHFLTKATRTLAIGMFTVYERSNCTISGATGKNGTPDSGQGKRKFDDHMITLIKDFLRTTYPKTYSFANVNRIIGQVAIETRNGRHRQSDETVLSVLKTSDAKKGSF